MSYISALDELEHLTTSDWPSAWPDGGFHEEDAALIFKTKCEKWRGLLCKFEKCLSELVSRYSAFELTMNLDYEGGNFFKAFEISGALYNLGRDYRSFLECGNFPLSLILYAFRCFFERGDGGDFYKPASVKYRNAIDEFWHGDGLQVEAKNEPGDFSRTIRAVWEKVFKDDELEDFAQKQGIPRELFCSRCWLIKNFQQGEGNSRLCHAIKYFKNFGDKRLRLHTENYPFDFGVRGWEHFKRLLENPACALEREYLIDFVDNGINGGEDRFSWFEKLDDKSKATLQRELLKIQIRNDEMTPVPYFYINSEFDFDVGHDVERIVIKFMLRGSRVVLCPFERRRTKWCYIGDIRDLAQPIWEITAIVKHEISNGTIFRTEDVLGRTLADCCDDDASDGAFLVNAENAQFYAPFSRRKIPAGQYFAYAFEYSNGNHLEVLRQIKNFRDNATVYVNGRRVGDDRRFDVTDKDTAITLAFNGKNFEFGMKRCSPVREYGGHEEFISKDCPQRLFINYHKWPLHNIETDWSYEVDGFSEQGTITENCLYKTGRLVFCSGGIQYDERHVTFVDFSSENVCRRFPVLGLGESANVSLDRCGSLDGAYNVGDKVTTYSIPIHGTRWRINIPIRREGISFRTEDGEEALSIPFAAENFIVEKYLAIEDFLKLKCTVFCSGTDEHAVITSMVYCNGTKCECHIPLLKDHDGFVLSDVRRYLAGRAGRDGDVLIGDLMSSRLKVRSIVIEKQTNGGVLHERASCRINLYDPKMEPPIERPRIVDGRISVKLYVPYCARGSAKRVMKWLPSTGLDSLYGVKELEGFNECYEQMENGRWCVALTKTTMYADIEGVLRSGASMLAFMADRGDGRKDRLISGGFCLLGGERALSVAGEQWSSAYDFHAAMHERYGCNSQRLGDMFGILTLLCWSDYTSIERGRRELSSRINQLITNINELGCGADMYMNSLYNTRSDQLSGYIYFAGWYFVERLYEEMRGVDDNACAWDAMEKCRSLLSSSGKQIWSPLMFSRRAYIMASHNAQGWWHRYYTTLSEQELTNDDNYPEVYWESIRQILRCIKIDVEKDVAGAARQLLLKIEEWRKNIDCRDIVCNDDTAADLFCSTQTLRNVLLELSTNDARFREEDVGECPRLLFYDVLRILNAQRMSNRF